MEKVDVMEDVERNNEHLKVLLVEKEEQVAELKMELEGDDIYMIIVPFWEYVIFAWHL